MEQDKRLIIYPRYINSAVQQVDGRRVAKQYCPHNPTIQEISAHLKKLYPTSEVAEEPTKRYPRGAVEAFDVGRVRISQVENVKKAEILKAVASSILNEKVGALKAAAAKVPQKGKNKK
ncbi:Signal_recognition particle 19 kDa protein [Hexamita inflata]|uniref:Signal recognition particle 19 kDa protein n=1 Tax=Hexamita inflata TaxID=28002 RepID=A0AA86PQ26_9EUKA|nr:Signal recognition particle 19 kDa protein [Hexamita inflata]CAI9941328.1 Signal recognition particle 19 kDa protein [Hexamita inflata]CAI9970282.1 Signal recognition particle 19 kDa protein [Hexamita inflata]